MSDTWLRFVGLTLEDDVVKELGTSAWLKEKTAAASPDAAGFQQRRTDYAKEQLAYIEVGISAYCCILLAALPLLYCACHPDSFCVVRALLCMLVCMMICLLSCGAYCTSCCNLVLAVLYTYAMRVVVHVAMPAYLPATVMTRCMMLCCITRLSTKTTTVEPGVVACRKLWSCIFTRSTLWPPSAQVSALCIRAPWPECNKNGIVGVKRLVRSCVSLMEHLQLTCSSFTMQCMVYLSF